MRTIKVELTIEVPSNYKIDEGMTDFAQVTELLDAMENRYSNVGLIDGRIIGEQKMERNERVKAADKYASRYTNENDARVARAAFMSGCEFEAQGDIVKGVVLETEEEHWKPSENQMSMLLAVVNDPNNAGSASCYISLKSLYNDLKKL